MLSGYRFYKTIVVLLALAIGVFAGYYLGKKIHAEYVVAGCLGALLAVCVFPLMKYAVALMGGLVGAFIGANSWSAISRMLQSGGELSDQAAENYWIGELVGLLVCGMLAFILFKVSVVLSTSVSGSTLAVMGALALLMQVQPWQEVCLGGHQHSRHSRTATGRCSGRHWLYPSGEQDTEPET